MQNNFPKIPLLLSVIFFICSSLVFLFFYKATNDNNQKSQSKEGEWQSEKLKHDEMKTVDHSLKIIEKERAQLETHFAQSSDIVPFLDTIEKLAPKAGVKAEVASVDILTDRTGLMVGMKASGTFGGLYKFLALLENSPYEIEFISMDMQKETELGGVESKNVSFLKWDVIFKIKLLSFVE